MDGELRANVLTFLSVERNRELNDIDEEMMIGLFNRIDREVRGALRPFGYYEPEVKSDFTGGGSEWHVTIDIEPGAPVMVKSVKVGVEGPGADDPVFDSVQRADVSCSEGMRLNHGAYEEVKGEPDAHREFQRLPARPAGSQ